MSLKAGWLALFIFVYVVGIILGSTFDYQSASASVGQSYSTGTATFTHGSSTVTGAGTVWVAGMGGGNIKADVDGVWYKIRYVGAGTVINGTGTVTGSPVSLAVGANAVDVTALGTLIIILPTGNTGTAATNVCTVVGSPVALVAGANTITTAGVVGNITVTTAGSFQKLILYSAYNNTGGAGLAYTMQPVPGWVGTGTGGYARAPSSTLGILMNVFQSFQRNPVAGTISLVTQGGEFWGAVFEIVTWQWSFMRNTDGTMKYGMIYWVFLFPFVAMGVLCVLLLFYGIVTGNISWG